MPRTIVALLLFLWTGIANAAFLCDESGERYTFTNAAALPTSAGTICFWLYPTYAQGDGTQHDMVFGRIDGTNFFLISKLASNALIAGWAVGSADYVSVASAGYTLNQNAWNSLCVTWDDTANDTFLYLNGSQIGSQTSTLTTGTTTSAFVGSQAGSGYVAKDPDAAFAEIAIWNRVLTTAELGQFAAKFSALFMTTDLARYFTGISDDSAGSFIFNARYGNPSNDIRLEAVVGFSSSLQTHPPIFYPRGMK